MDEQKEFPFEFSVVMAVYNVEPFLREAVNSLITQNFGFERIQLIMVDDGSTDGSGAICDEYAESWPDNVVVIHKENGGVASARNEGLKYATGRYLNFMDSDDRFTHNAFNEVHRFFLGKEDEIDIVTIPLEFFDAQRGPHWQNGKFKKGSRILDLYWDYQATIMFVNASFFVNEVKDQICFDSRLVCGEDIKVLLTILRRKMKLGVVNRGRYMYRRRSIGGTSLIQSSRKKHGWYFDYFTYLIDWGVSFYRERFGYLPAFLQYELLADLQWRFKENYANIESVLTPDEVEQYKSRLFQSLQYFDDEYVMQQKKLFAEHKCFLLTKKYNHLPNLAQRNTNIIPHFGNTNFPSVSNHISKIEFFSIVDNYMAIEGFTKIFGVTVDTPLDVLLKVNDDYVPCEIKERDEINDYFLGDLVFRGIAFSAQIPLRCECTQYKIQLVLKYKDSLVIKRNIRYGTFSPIGNIYTNSYYYSDGWCIKVRGNAIIVTKAGKRAHLKQEWAFLKELWKANKTGTRKAVVGRLAYHFFKLFPLKRIWLISDRPMHAGDNGEALFTYLMGQKDRNHRFYFVLSPESPDYDRLKKIGNVIPHLSWRHKLLYLLSENVISSQGEQHIFRPFQPFSESYRDLSQHQRFIFLQHGVTQNDLANWLNRYNKNIAMFVTTSVFEQESILNGNYYYTQKEVKLTGFPRHDLLYHNEKKQIVIMPTWRAYLVTEIDQSTGKKQLKSGFEASTYYTMYHGLLSNTQLFDKAHQLGYSIAFLPHPNMICSIDAIPHDPRLVMLSSANPYRVIFAESDLLVTDYSSVAFDFAYLRKPVIYFQEDAEEFFSGAHTVEKGYFNYERDGFGEVEYNCDNIASRIIEYMENNCQVKDNYRQRIDATFPFNDQNNCQRVYEKILELDKQE